MRGRAAHLLLALSLAACASASPRVASQRGYDARAWRADYDALRAHLERSWSNLTWLGSSASAVHLPALHARTLAALEAARRDEDAEAALEAFVAGMRDGHLAMLPRVEPRPAVLPAAPSPPSRALPPAEGCAALGFARTRGIAFSARFEATPGFRLLAAGEPESYRAGLARLPGGGRVGLLRVASFRSTELVLECEQAWGELQRAHPEGACDRACERELSHRVLELALQGLRARLRALAAEGATSVLLDLGGNGGGNDLGDFAPRAFTSAPVRSAPLGLVRTARSAAYLGEQLARFREALAAETSAPAREALGRAIAEYERLQRGLSEPPPCDLSWVWRERRPWSRPGASSACSNVLFGDLYASGPLPYLAPGALASPRAAELLYWPSVADAVLGSWTGPVFALLDGRTGSAAEDAAALLQDNRVATLLGTRTAGLGCGFMYSGAEFTLPHSRRRVRVPNCARLRPDGTNEVAGVRPDVELPPYEGESDAERAARVLRALEAASGRPP